jgi:hypothetical protein
MPVMSMVSVMARVVVPVARVSGARLQTECSGAE